MTDVLRSVASGVDNDVVTKRDESGAGRVCLGIDIGGTKIAVGVVDDHGRVIEQRKVATPRGGEGDGEALLRAVVGAVDDLPEPAQPYLGVGVGSVGPMRWPSGVVSPLNVPGWREFPLRERLRELFPGLPVRVHNDAVCAAVAEHWLGAGRGVANMLGMVVSTGVGGGFILSDRLVNGSSGNAGHVGHVVVDPVEPPCVCGGIGCLEAIASGPSLAAWAHERGWRTGAPEAQRTGRELSADAGRGDSIALDAMNRAGHALGIAIASMTVALDLAVVAIGGGVSQAGPLLFDPLHETLRTHIGMDFAKQVSAVPVELGQDAGIIGAGALIHRADAYWSAD